MTPTILGILAVIFGLLAVVIAVGVALQRQRALPEIKRGELPGKPGGEAPRTEAPRAVEPARELPGLPTPRDISERERYRRGLAQTRGGFVSRLADLFKGRPAVSDELKEEIETILFTADIGARTAERLLGRVSAALDRSAVADPKAVWEAIRREAREILEIPAPPIDYSPTPGPYVLLMIGVNGVGKTTTLGKLAACHRDAGRRVLLVAGDTFRAAATEQLEVWAERVGAAIHRGSEGADPSSVIHDGIVRGRDENFDVVLCDTAGRLHTKKELMAELGKIRRSCAKALRRGLGPAVAESINGPHDTFLVLDATIGQNALAQAELFKETMDFTGLVVTKLDGTAKGGVSLGVCEALGVPIRFVGIGERVEDLRDFDPEMFVDALFATDSENGGSDAASEA